MVELHLEVFIVWYHTGCGRLIGINVEFLKFWRIDLKLCTHVPWHVLNWIHSQNLPTASTICLLQLRNYQQAFVNIVLSNRVITSAIFVWRGDLVLWGRLSTSLPQTPHELVTRVVVTWAWDQMFCGQNSFMLSSSHACILLAMWASALSYWKAQCWSPAMPSSHSSKELHSHAHHWPHCDLRLLHVLKLFNESGCPHPDSILSSLICLTVYRNIVTVLTSSFPFIKSLIDLISEALEQPAELSYLSRGPPRVKPNYSGGHFLLLQC